MIDDFRDGLLNIIATSPVYRKHMTFVHPKLRLSATVYWFIGLLVANLPSKCSRQCFYLVDVDIESGVVRIVFSASTIFLIKSFFFFSLVIYCLPFIGLFGWRSAQRRVVVSRNY